MPSHSRLIRCPEVLSRLGVSKTHLYRLIASGAFPRPIPLGRQVVAWLDSEVDSWIEQQRDKRDQLRSA